MKTKTDVSLNGVLLSDIDPRIIVEKISEPKPGYKINAVSFGGGVGQLVTKTERQYVEVDVEYAIAERMDYAARAEIHRKVIAWAYNGGELRVNYRPGMMLDVALAELPDLGGIREWTKKDYKLIFRAYAVPYWQDSHMIISEYTNTDDGITMNLTGNAKAPIDYTFTLSAACTVTISANGTKAVWTASNANMLYTYSHNGIFATATLTNGTTVTDIMSERDESSTDEVLLVPGQNTIDITTTNDATITGTISVRGRWL